jgi:hypothetical protein
MKNRTLMLFSWNCLTVTCWHVPLRGFDWCKGSRAQDCVRIRSLQLAHVSPCRPAHDRASLASALGVLNSTNFRNSHASAVAKPAEPAAQLEERLSVHIAEQSQASAQGARPEEPRRSALQPAERPAAASMRPSRAVHYALEPETRASARIAGRRSTGGMAE